MKRTEFEKCVGCGKGMAAELMHFYRVTVEKHVLDARGIQRQHGIESMAGSLAIAAALGPDEDHPVEADRTRVLVFCDACSPSLPVGAP